MSDSEITTDTSAAKKAADSISRPAEWGIAGSVGLGLAEMPTFDGGPEWLPIVSGIVSLILRILPVFLR